VAEELKTLPHQITSFNPVDILLFLSALKLARRAQRVRWVPVPDVVKDIAARGGGGWDFPVPRVELAAARAVNKWRRWFDGFDTCLIRSLVLGGLLADRGEVMLNIGFRPGEAEPSVDGHAWVTVDGNRVGADGDLARERYTRVLTVPFLRGSGEK
jgi:hypothetical protein